MEVVTEFVKEHVCVYNFTNERQPTIPCDASFDLVDVKFYPRLVPGVSGVISTYGQSLRTPSSSRSNFAETITTRKS